MSPNGDRDDALPKILRMVKVVVGVLVALFGLLFTAFIFWLPYHDEGTFTPAIIALLVIGVLIVASGTWTFLNNV
jgi:mannose/fructose/N-acetylgalactosamine-specific phosphotransferase system component IID